MNPLFPHRLLFYDRSSSIAHKTHSVKSHAAQKSPSLSFSYAALIFFKQMSVFTCTERGKAAYTLAGAAFVPRQQSQMKKA
jgi:hypothetical protein